MTDPLTFVIYKDAAGQQLQVRVKGELLVMVSVEFDRSGVLVERYMATVTRATWKQIAEAI